MKRTLFPATIGLAFLCMLQPATISAPANAQSGESSGASWERLVGDEPETFADVGSAVEAFKSRLAAGDKQGVAKLLGLDPVELMKQADFDDNFADIAEAAAAGVRVEEVAPDRRILELGEKNWEFPFPLVLAEGTWAFDTYDGIDEVINRRIGENELRAIATLRAFVDAEEEYKTSDWDDDGVMEYAQKLRATPETYDGLYWPAGEGVPESPAGPYIAEAGPDDKAEGYFGYRGRLLTSQGDNVVGGKYDYVVNGNMISGFAMIAWPVEYEETGVMTFIVNQGGVVYQKDLGADTEKLAAEITSFDPDDSWTVVEDPGQ